MEREIIKRCQYSSQVTSRLRGRNAWVCRGGYRILQFSTKYPEVCGQVLNTLRTGPHYQPYGTRVPPPAERFETSWREVCRGSGTQDIKVSFRTGPHYQWTHTFLEAEKQSRLRTHTFPQAKKQSCRILLGQQRDHR